MAVPAHREDREEVMEKIRKAASARPDDAVGPSPAPALKTLPKTSSGPQETGEAVPYLRRDVIVRHRRRRPLLGFLRLVAHGLLVAGLPIAALTWALTSPRLSLQELSVQGTSRVTEAWVRQTVEPWMGENLFQLSLAAIQERLEQHPWAGGASVRKELPDRLEIVVTEKVPVALAEGSEKTFLVDAQGELIAALPAATLSEATPSEATPSEATPSEATPSEATLSGSAAAADYPALPLVRGATKVPDDIARALAIYREFQELDEGRLLGIEILGYDDYRLKPESWPYPLLVSSGSLREKHKYLGRLMAAIETRQQRVEAVDLRFAQKIVLQPEGPPGASGRRLLIRG